MANKNKCFPLRYQYSPGTDSTDVSRRKREKYGVTDCGRQPITAGKMPDPVWKIRRTSLRKIKRDG